MSEEVQTYAESLGLPATQEGEIQALQVLGVQPENILPAIEDVNRLPPWFRGPIDQAVEDAEE